MHRVCRTLTLAVVAFSGCGGGGGESLPDGAPLPPPAPACAAGAGGGGTVGEPELVAELGDRWHESWLSSPAIVDLDGDEVPEIVVGRDDRLVVWHADGEVIWSRDVGGRIWAAPIVADLVPESEGLEVAVAARGEIHAWQASGDDLTGFPVSWQNEMRSLAADDIDGDGSLELVAVTTSPLEDGGQRDIVIAVESNGAITPGFPPNTTGSSGCTDACYVTGGYDQNIALGDLDGDGRSDVLATQDNAYLSVHDGTGRAFDAAERFGGRDKIQGVRWLLDDDQAAQGYAEDEDSANQAHFTNSAPAIADLDGDAVADAVVLGSVQNASQSDRERGVVVFAFRPDGTRLDSWVEPFHAGDYLGGLWDLGGNVVAATNQVAVADLDPDAAGPELIFAGFDGIVRAVDARAREMWSYRFTSDPEVLVGGVVVADLSADGAPEVVFASYSPDDGKGALTVLDGGGNELHRVALPGRGAMAVPSIADADGDGALEIVVSLKDGADDTPLVLVYRVPGSETNCLLWPTGRGNWQRTGHLPVAE